MEKTRVSKGEKYWFIRVDEQHKLAILPMFDTYIKTDDARFEDGNYFHTKEEAESIVCKLRAVLNGAEVIEMPSKEEFLDFISPLGDTTSDERIGRMDCFNWLKSKIVK